MKSCVCPVGSFNTPQDLDAGGILMYENGRVGSTAITCGPHRGPGHYGHEGTCDRMVLFITMTRAIAVPYDSDDQVNAVDVIASQHGRHSREFMWAVIDMELVRGVRAVATMRGVTSVSVQQCNQVRFPLAPDEVWVDSKLSLQSLMDAIVSVAHRAAALLLREVPPRRGTAGSTEGIPVLQAQGAAFGIYMYLSCPRSDENQVWISLRSRLCGEKMPAKDRETSIRTSLLPIKRIWQMDVAAEDLRQGTRWEAVRRKLRSIDLRTSRENGEASSGPSTAAGKKRKKTRKSPDKRLSGKLRARRRSGPYADLQGPLDSSEGESSHGVESPDDSQDDSSVVCASGQTSQL